MSCRGKMRKGIDLRTQLSEVSMVIGTILSEFYEYEEEMLMQCDFRFSSHIIMYQFILQPFYLFLSYKNNQLTNKTRSSYFSQKLQLRWIRDSNIVTIIHFFCLWLLLLIIVHIFNLNFNKYSFLYFYHKKLDILLLRSHYIYNLLVLLFIPLYKKIYFF